MKRRTWTKSSDVADWTYLVPWSGIKDIDLNNPKERNAWFIAQIDKLLNLLGEFADPEEVHVCTIKEGDEAYVSKLGTTEQKKALYRFLEKDDVTDIEIDLNLNVLGFDEDGQIHEFKIIKGGYLIFWVELNYETGEIDLSKKHPVWFTLFIEADIYSPCTLGPISDNRILAELNGPRLTRFLLGIESSFPVEFQEVDSPNYWYVATPYGFMTVEEWEQKNPDLIAEWEQEKAARSKKSDE